MTLKDVILDPNLRPCDKTFALASALARNSACDHLLLVACNEIPVKYLCYGAV